MIVVFLLNGVQRFLAKAFYKMNRKGGGKKGAVCRQVC